MWLNNQKIGKIWNSEGSWALVAFKIQNKWKLQQRIWVLRKTKIYFTNANSLRYIARRQIIYWENGIVNI